MPVHAHMWSIPTTSLRGTVPRAWKPRGMTHVSRESRSGGAGLIASVCDRRAHSALFNPSNNPVASVVLSWFCKGRWILEKIMNLSQRARNQTTIYRNFPSSGDLGWIAVSVPSSHSGAPALHTLLWASCAHRSSGVRWRTFPLVRRKGLFSSQVEHGVFPTWKERWKQ